MASDLYEVLDLLKDAAPDEIRKAYKKKALKTHPDRILSPNATPAEKADAEEQFRKVNNAYEVLSDPLKRKEYDVHGVWPPPEPNHDDYYSHPSSSRPRDYPQYHRRGPFEDPFFAHPHHHSFATFAFTDPFTLFNTVFPEFFPRSSRFGHPQRSFPPFFDDPFSHMNTVNTMMADIHGSMFPSINSFDHGTSGFIGSGPMGGSQERWASESFMTSSVNGVTTTIHKKRDFEGNEHVTKTYADGRTIHTINGIEQSPGSRGYLPQTSDARRSSQRPDLRYLPSPPPRPVPTPTSYNNQRIDYARPPQPMPTQLPYNSQRSNYSVPPPPPYPGQRSGGYPAPPPLDGHLHHRFRRSSEKHPYPADTSAPYNQSDDRPHQRKWWPRRA